MSSLGDQSEKKKKKNNTSSETVPLAEHKILKEQYESLKIEHESLIKTLELLEKTLGFTVDNLVNDQLEALVGREVVEKWDDKFGEMQKKLETVEKNIEDIMSVDEIEMNGVDSGIATPAEKPNVKNSVSNEDVIAISDDEDEENQRESNGRHSNSSYQNPFIL